MKSGTFAAGPNTITATPYTGPNGTGDAGIHFIDNEVHRVIKTREEAKVYYVDLVDGEVVETELPGEMIE